MTWPVLSRARAAIPWPPCRPPSASTRCIVCSPASIAPRPCAPYTPFRKSSAVYQVVRHALDHADIAVARRGPHVLRHTVATQLVRHGFSLKVVGDLLGHQHPDSTLPYTKLAIEDLREVALEVPESGR